MYASEIVVRKKHHVNMGNFDNVETEFTARFVVEPGDDRDDVARVANKYVEDQLASDLERARDTTASDSTYLDWWMDGPTRRSQRSAVRRTR